MHYREKPLAGNSQDVANFELGRHIGGCEHSYLDTREVQVLKIKVVIAA